MLYGMMQDYEILADYANIVSETEGRMHQPVMAAEDSADTVTEDDMSVGLSAEKIEGILKNWTATEILTRREKDVLFGLLENRKRKDIADELNVTEHTIKKHTANIFSKMDVTSRVQLLEKALKEAQL